MTPKSRGLVSGAEVGRHLTCDDAHIRRLTDQGVIVRLEGGYDLTDARNRYIAHLRSERKKTRGRNPPPSLRARAPPCCGSVLRRSRAIP
jgi:hypothetical protein